MSNLTVKGNTSGTGTVILEAPNTNSNRTITLPDATATLATTADVAAASSFTLLGTLNTTSGSTQTLSGLTLTDYKIIYFSAAGISAAATTALVLAGFTVATLADAADTFSGIGFLDISGSNGQAVRHSVGSGTGSHTLTTASTSISITASSSTFDAGSIRIYGVK